MAQEYTISNAYPAKDKAGNHKSWTGPGGEMFVWRLFFEGVDGYFLTNKKAGNEPKKGDVVYGTLGEDKFGNGTFKSESRPLGQLPSQPQTSAAPSGDIQGQLDEVHAKLDHLITLVENLAEQKDSGVDLSDIPF